MKNLFSGLKFIGALGLSVLIVAGIIELARIFVPEISTTIAAVVAFSGTILAAIINNYFTRVNQTESDERKNKYQIDSEERVKQAQIKADTQREKQNNYNDLLSSIGKYIREPDLNNDDFHTIHIKSWIYGSEDIIKKTAEFVALNRREDFEKLNRAMEDLLRLMRRDTGLQDIDSNLKIGNPFKEQQIMIKKRGPKSE